MRNFAINISTFALILASIFIPNNAFAQQDIHSISIRTDSFFNGISNVCDGNPTVFAIKQGFVAQFRPGTIFKSKIDIINATELEGLNQGISKKIRITYYASNQSYLRKYDNGQLQLWVTAGNNGGVLGADASDFQRSLEAQADTLRRRLGQDVGAGNSFQMDRELAGGLTLLEFTFYQLSDGSLKLNSVNGDETAAENQIYEFLLLKSDGKWKKRDCSMFAQNQSVFSSVLFFGLTDALKEIYATYGFRDRICKLEKFTTRFPAISCQSTFQGLSRSAYSDQLKFSSGDRSVLLKFVSILNENNIRVINSNIWGDYTSEAQNVAKEYMVTYPIIIEEYRQGKTSDQQFLNQFQEKDLILFKFFQKFDKFFDIIKSNMKN